MVDHHCKKCGCKLHAVGATLAGSGSAPWWVDEQDSVHCPEGLLHQPVKR